jgi:hypothetical protein
LGAGTATGDTAAVNSDVAMIAAADVGDWVGVNSEAFSKAVSSRATPGSRV